MRLETFFENFELLADAPNGVQKLRQLILQLAVDFITDQAIQNSSTNLIPRGRVIICTRMGLGKIAITNINVAINQDLKAIELANKIDINYFYNFYLTQNIIGTGVTVSGIRQSELLSFIVPIPPLNEQKRIVAKVNQLMALCDKLETRQQKRREGCVRLNNATIDQLLTIREPDNFSKHWQSICDNFDLLYSAPENIGKLRQAILQLAVQGKLVPQDPIDEPASVLLEKIKAEKERLVKEGKIRKDKPLPPIKLDEVPFELPRGWEWVRFCDIAFIASNLVKPEFYLDLPHVAPDNIEKQTGKLLLYRTVREDNVRSGNHQFFIGQILYSKIRPNLAKVTIVHFNGLCSADMYPINAYINSNYLLKYMLSQTFLNMAIKNDTRVAMPKINQDELNKILVPVPPLFEQKRIVTKVDQVMALCDDLEPTFRRCDRKCCIFANDVNATFWKHDSITTRYQGTGY